MDTSLDSTELESYVLKLLAHYIPDSYRPNYSITPFLSKTMERIEKSFSKIQKKYYVKDGVSFFDHLNSDHFSAFLYFFSNTIWCEVGDSALPERLFYLNKIMNGIDLYYPVEMPETFLLVHPLGTVLGRACYGNYLAVYQNCTIGAVTDIYPRFGEGVILYSRSSVLGNCNIGNNVVFGANSLVIDCNVPDNSLVVGQYPNHRCLPNRISVRDRVFDDPYFSTY